MIKLVISVNDRSSNQFGSKRICKEVYHTLEGARAAYTDYLRMISIGHLFYAGLEHHKNGKIYHLARTMDFMGRRLPTNRRIERI